MELKTEKLGLIEWILKLKDITVIEKLKKIHDENPVSADWWDKISVSEKESIQKGLIDIEEGRVHSDETARKIYEKYL